MQSHHSKLFMAFLKEKKVRYEFVPPYSSSLNPQEHLWASMKMAWKRKLAKETLVYDRDRFMAPDILEICRNLTVTPRLMAHQLKLFDQVKKGKLA